MTEREMEDLLWEYPEKLLNEPLKKFQRQPSSAVGRADLVFEDRIGRLLVIELKRDTLERGAITQLVDYYGMLKTAFPGRAVELMIVASRIPPERRVACEQFDIEAREIPLKRFRDVAEEVGYVFKSEATASSEEPQRPIAAKAVTASIPRTVDHSRSPLKVERAWFHLDSGHGDFAAFVNARGSCSMRLFDPTNGAFRNRVYRSGDFQDSFQTELRTAVRLHISRQPTLDRECKQQLPAWALSELQGQIRK